MRSLRRYMWKTLGGFLAESRRSENILPLKNAQIHCGATDLVLFRKPQVPPRLPQPTIHQQGGGLPVGHGVRRLVQPHPPPQWHQIRDAPRAPQRPGRCDLSSPGQGLRRCTSPTSASMESQHPLLASAGGGLDQSTTSGKSCQNGYVGNGRLNGGRGVIFPGSHRSGVFFPQADTRLL